MHLETSAGVAIVDSPRRADTGNAEMVRAVSTPQAPSAPGRCRWIRWTAQTSWFSAAKW